MQDDDMVDNIPQFGNYTVIEVPKDEKRIRACAVLGLDSNNPQVVNEARWLLISEILILPPCDSQHYAARNLKSCPHYQVGALSLSSFLSDVEKYRRKYKFKVSFGHEEIRGNPNLHVMEQNDTEVEAIWSDFDFHELATAAFGKSLSKKKKELADPMRGNVKSDFGFTSTQNMYRDAKSFHGLAQPRLHEDTINNNQVVEAFVRLSRMQSLLSLCKVCPHECHNLPLRRKLFAATIHEENKFESLRVALTNESHILKPHIDTNNDDDPNYAWVLVYSKNIEIEGVRYRMAIIGYSRYSISSVMSKDKIIGPLVELVCQYINELPSHRRDISTDLFRTYDDPKYRAGIGNRLPPHLNKNVFASPFADRILFIMETCRKAGHALSNEQCVALLYPIIAASTPDYYWLASNWLIDEYPPSELCGMTPLQICCALYNKVWDCREEVTNRKGSHHGHRYMPSHNTRQDTSAILRSLEVITAMYHAYWGLNDFEVNDPHFFERANAVFAHTKDGIAGSGSFTSQHILTVAALVGIIPAPASSMGVLSKTTTTWKEIMSRFGFTDKQHEFVATQLIDCVCAMTGVSRACAENAVCEYFRGEKAVSINDTYHSIVTRYVDSYYPGQRLFAYDPTSKSVFVYSPKGTIATIDSSSCKSRLEDKTVLHAFWDRKQAKDVVRKKKTKSKKAPAFIDHIPRHRVFWTRCVTTPRSATIPNWYSIINPISQLSSRYTVNVVERAHEAMDTYYTKQNKPYVRKTDTAIYYNTTSKGEKNAYTYVSFSFVAAPADGTNGTSMEQSAPPVTEESGFEVIDPLVNDIPLPHLFQVGEHQIPSYIVVDGKLYHHNRNAAEIYLSLAVVLSVNSTWFANRFVMLAAKQQLRTRLPCNKIIPQNASVYHNMMQSSKNFIVLCHSKYSPELPWAIIGKNSQGTYYFQTLTPMGHAVTGSTMHTFRLLRR